VVKDVWPILHNCLGYADQKLVDYSALCIIRVIESHHCAHADKLEVLVDKDLIRAAITPLFPAGGIPANTYTPLIKSMATVARASPSIAVALLEADIVTTLC
jgi:E3 ubiquitin-protein ligase TRIP12